MTTIMNKRKRLRQNTYPKQGNGKDVDSNTCEPSDIIDVNTINYSKKNKNFLWDQMPWKSVNMETESLGDFNDAMFFGLEELDGNSYKLDKGTKGGSNGYTLSMPIKQKKEYKEQMVEDEAVVAVDANDSKKKKEKKAKKETNVSQDVAANISSRSSGGNSIKAPSEAAAVSDTITDENVSWGKVKLHNLLHKALLALNFTTPTPIQMEAVPLITKGEYDIVGAAETGSGKTLAFGLPVIHSILHNYKSIRMVNHRCPYALILAPTRELAMQITKVLKEVCDAFKDTRRIEVISVVGGMAEQKQRRQLSGHGRPVDILVATPGRLCEIVKDDDIVAFKDMSKVRYLIVDEADRMVEDGHFPELDRVFSRITDHEKVSESKYLIKYKKATATTSSSSSSSSSSGKRGGKNVTMYGNEEYMMEEDDGSGDENDKFESFLNTLKLPEFDEMPSEKALANARKRSRNIYDEYYDEQDKDDVSAEPIGVAAAVMVDGDSIGDAVVYRKLRQTLLFSATAAKMSGQQLQQQMMKKKKVKQSNAALSNPAVRLLPDHLQKLLSSVAIQSSIKIVDVINDSTAATATAANGKKSSSSSSSSSVDVDSIPMTVETVNNTLPKSLSQLEIRMPSEDKDTMAYYYILKNVGRTLLFANSIKTARRVDGLLRALGLNCRVIHAQLQQKQRMKALESFQSSPVGILIATDVAARGLDIPRINHVIHYDVARSPQLYIHRSGRTARASMAGTTVSLVAPEDNSFHDSTCQVVVTKKTMPVYKVDLSVLPLLRERVSIAKKMFTQSFVLSQKSKEKNWIEQSAEDADIEMDDYMIDEIGVTNTHRKKKGDVGGSSSSSSSSSVKNKNNNEDEERLALKRNVDKLRCQLAVLLNTPIELANRGISSRKKGFIVVAK